MKTYFSPAEQKSVYYVQFSNGDSDYAFAGNAIEAIARVRSWRDVFDESSTANLAASARLAVYGEMECDTRHFRNDGTHLAH